jgi:hypothetical protein
MRMEINRINKIIPLKIKISIFSIGRGIAKNKLVSVIIPKMRLDICLITFSINFQLISSLNI